MQHHLTFALRQEEANEVCARRLREDKLAFQHSCYFSFVWCSKRTECTPQYSSHGCDRKELSRRAEAIMKETGTLKGAKDEDVIGSKGSRYMGLAEG